MPDGSRAGYWHLQKDGALVNVGDTVKEGQVIALSGKTGYAFQPHLHFMVWASGMGQWRQMPTRFQTSKGIKYLRPWKKYRKLKAIVYLFLSKTLLVIPGNIPAVYSKYKRDQMAGMGQHHRTDNERMVCKKK